MMTFELRFLVIVLAAFAWSSLVASALVAWRWRRRLRAGDDAGALVRLRLFPAAVGSATAALAAVAYLLFEPRGLLHEPLGIMLPALALSGGTLAAVAFAGVIRSYWITRRAVRAWTAAGETVRLPGITAPALVVASEFPVVAVIGWLRPTVIIARSVLDACTPEELRAILAHEQAHIDERDNLKRLALGHVPDPLTWTPLGRHIQAAWLQASEDAADDSVGRLGPEGRPLLAQALIRVARLVPPGARLTVPLSALYCGEGLDRRIRRLLGPPSPPRPRQSPGRVRVAGVLLFASSVLALEAVHHTVEAAVAFLP